jgi:hypothetical protein
VDSGAVHRFSAERFIVKPVNPELWTGWRFTEVFVAETQRDIRAILLIRATELLAATQFSD